MTGWSFICLRRLRPLLASLLAALTLLTLAGCAAQGGEEITALDQLGEKGRTIGVASDLLEYGMLQQDYLFYKRAYEDQSQNALWSYMLDYFTDRYIALAMEKLGADRLDEQLRFSIRHYCYGSVGTTREWLLNDNITPAESAVEMMFASMPENMRSVFFDS